MKPQQDRHANRHCAALTRVDVLVLLGVVVVLFLVLLWLGPYQEARLRAKVARIVCIQNLRQIGVAHWIWRADHDNQFPASALITNASMRGWIAAGNAVPFFQLMSNELFSPKVLVCPADRDHVATANLTNGLSAKNISYFFGLDATDTNAQSLLSGDDNFEISGVPVKPGLVEIPTNAPLSWTAARHNFAGNISLADSSVQQVTQSDLRRALMQTGVATNRLLIP
ncbi:MAG TPA: hypothetical protein VL527_01045 [Dongiaceae bacterium]|jgi:hypothetical protein|nr:hypothetical protein [Dongiaceae bacterium]